MLSYPFRHRHSAGARELRSLLGGKGAGLALMAGELGLPVPPGFTLTTEACALHRAEGFTPALEAALREGVAGIEAETGRRFGDPSAPLLLSVRSGAPLSMPGMLDSVLDLGLDAGTQRALGEEDPAFAEDCRARLAASFQSSVGTPPPDRPWDQLRAAVEAVFRSVGSARAAAYLRREGEGDGELLTAVNVQAMVFGNRDAASATGVVFSRDPATGEARLYGDVLFRAQGEDVVSGRRRTSSLATLAERLPDVALTLDAATQRLERHYRDLVEVEFTVERGRLWLLQVRVGKRTPRAALRIAVELALQTDFPLTRAEAVERVAPWLAEPPRDRSLEPSEGGAEPWARGLGASPGVATGELVVDVDAALRRAAAGADVILCRPETSPADVEGMQAAAGLLTAHGGLASHAAVIARGWGIPAVVGVPDLAIDADGIELSGRRIAVGEVLSVDGGAGAVFPGSLTARERPLPEVERLQGWAGELGIELPKPAALAAPAAPEPLATTEADAVGVDDVLRTLSIKGQAAPEGLAAALGSTPDALAALLETLAAEGRVEPARPLGVKLSEPARADALALLEQDRSALGAAAADAALERFQGLDARMKQAVTDWQLRTVAGEQVPNDHTDAAWDAGVLAELSALCAEVVPLLEAPCDALPRLARYTERLASAARRAEEGDARFVASPRVDSVHGIWFELHEELIRLAGRTRGEELAAGRAG